MIRQRFTVDKNDTLGTFVTASKAIEAGAILHIEAPIIVANDSDISEAEKAANITRSLKIVFNLAKTFPDGVCPELDKLATPVEAMSESERRDIIKFAMAYGLKSHSVVKFYKMVFANSFDVNIANQTSPTATVLFETASFFNHSCLANCHHTFTADGSITITAARDVAEGEELRINYLTGSGASQYSPEFPSEYFLEELGARFGFACNCGNH